MIGDPSSGGRALGLFRMNYSFNSNQLLTTYLPTQVCSDMQYRILYSMPRWMHLCINWACIVSPTAATGFGCTHHRLSLFHSSLGNRLQLFLLFLLPFEQSMIHSVWPKSLNWIGLSWSGLNWPELSSCQRQPGTSRLWNMLIMLYWKSPFLTLNHSIPSFRTLVFILLK